MSLADILGINIPQWQYKAACANYLYDHWTSDWGARNREGKRVCETECPVKAQCLQWALEQEKNGSTMFGIYGGKTPDERSALRLCKFKYCNNPVGEDKHASVRYCSNECSKKAINLRKRKENVSAKAGQAEAEPRGA